MSASAETPGTLASTPPGGWEPMVRLARRARRPLERFLRIEAASGALLLVAAGVALVLANSPWAGAYESLWHTPLGLRIGTFTFERSLEWFVNDVLMAIFFFVVGMEIRREIHHGELSEWRRAALPAAAAIGGMIAPALLYVALTASGEARAGWGIPMATDIAFAVGVLALLGKRVPAALRVLLLALAVIDDLGAIIVIALFYSAGISPVGLLVAAAGVGGIFAFRALGVRRVGAYLLPGFIVWAGTYAAGIHPTIAGVVVGLSTPVVAWLGAEGFVAETRQHLADVSAQLAGPGDREHGLRESLHLVDIARREALSPAEVLIEALHPWVAFLIMPVFALANAGVRLEGLSLDGAAMGVGVAVALGLVLGKPLGILAASLLVLRLRIAVLPLGLRLRHLVVLGLVAGIGFTMSLFVANLAFGDSPFLGAAKLGVLGASAVAIVVSLLAGRFLLPAVVDSGAARSADEAEASTEQ